MAAKTHVLRIVSRKLAARSLVLLGLMLYIALFWVCYQRNVYPIEAHMGVGYEPRPLFEIALIVCLTLLPVAILPLEVRRPSQFFCWGMYTIVYIPSLLYTAWDDSPFVQALEMDLALLGGLTILWAGSALPILRMPVLRMGSVAFWSVFAVVSAVFYAICVSALGASINFVSSMTQIYVQRAVFAEQIGFPENYALAWQSQVLNPLLMAYAVYRRNLFLFLVGFAGQIFFFGLGAMKSMPASAVLILAMVPMMQNQGRSFAIRWILSLVILFGIGAVFLTDTRNLGTAILTDLILWRVFVGPGYLTVLYFEFFRTNPVAMFGEVKGFNLFFTSPYDGGYKAALGWFYWGQLTDPNVNLWGDGFANAHLAGVLIESLIAMVALWLLDGVSEGLDIRLVVLMSSFQLICFTNGPIMPVLVGGGFLLLLLILMAFPREGPQADSPHIRNTNQVSVS